MKNEVWSFIAMAAAVATCVLGGGCSSDAASGAGCADLCAKGVALHCPQGTTQEECEQKCTNPEIPPACRADYDAYSECLKGASTLICGHEGPHAAACDPKQEAVINCVLRQLGDAGI
jgi:hypothetical protein